jgi:hypothetical protein
MLCAYNGAKNGKVWLLCDYFGGSFCSTLPVIPYKLPIYVPDFKSENFARSCSILFRVRVVPSTSLRPRNFMTMTFLPMPPATIGFVIPIIVQAARRRPYPKRDAEPHAVIHRSQAYMIHLLPEDLAA